MFAVLSLTGSNEQAKPKLSIPSSSTAADTAKNNKVTDEPPSIPLPSPMNDPTWLEYVEHSGLMGVAAELPMGLGMRPRNNTNPLPLMAPEITHLRSNSTTAAAAAAFRRPSLDNLGALPKVQQMLSRRSPKTRYAQQQHKEKEQQQQRNRSQDHGRLKKKASVELIAEQYRAMLDYKDRLEEGFAYDEDEEAPPVPEKDDVNVEPELPLLQPRKFSGGNGSSSHSRSRSRSPGERVSPRTRTPPQREVVLERPPVVTVEDAGDMSPQSDCTLIGFEEDVIYFKPVSFGPSPPASPKPEVRPRKKSADRGPTPPLRTHKETRQLDIGLDLLHGELSSSLARGGGCHRRQSEDRLSDLQLTIMIDAYENLRERTKTMDLADGDRENMARMFESWVSTLHNIRGSLVTRGGLI